jgi:undecaprenyl-diphosphatase
VAAETAVAAEPAGERETSRAIAADRRLSLMGYGKALLIGSAQIAALLPGISRDGIVTVTGMLRGVPREDAVRFSFLLSTPVILAAGVLKVPDLTGPLGNGIRGQVLVGSLLAFVGAYLSVRFLTRYFAKDRPLTPFGIYCLLAGLGSLAYLLAR